MASGLITKNTDLKSLKYGSMPLGSDKPYVAKNIGQAPGSQIGTEISRRIDDTSRIAQMLIDKPGIKYLLHEAELQQIGVGDRIKKARKGGKSVAGAVLGQLGNTLVTTLKIVGSTLAQVPVNGTGTHFLKGFRTDTYLQPTNPGNSNAFTRFFGAGGIEGAPSAIEGKPIEGVVKSQFFAEGSTTNNGKIVNPNDSTVEPKFIYEAKVQPVGKGTLSTNERPNASLPENDANRASANNAVEGSAIPVGYKKPITFGKKPTKEIGDLSPTIKRGVETTATPGVPIFQNSIKSRSNIVDSKDWTSPDSISNVGKDAYSYSASSTGTSADTAVLNAQTGAPIRVVSGSSQQRESTATPRTLGISNKDVVGDVGETSTDNIGTKYSSADTYTGGSTTENIRRAAMTTGSLVRIPIRTGKRNEEDYFRNNSNKPTDGGVTAETLESVGDVYMQGITLGETSIPKKVSLKTLAYQINTGSADLVSRDGESTDYTPTLQDFRKGSATSYSYDYNSATVNKEQRVGLGNQGKSSKRTNYMIVDSLMVDKLNQQDISDDRVDGTKPDDVRDFAKFFFEIITPDGSKFLYFRAFIDSIDDGYNADWQGRKYNGRAESFYTYGGFDRDISISFNIAAASRSEMKPLYKKMVYLASATAPTYGTSGLMRGTLARMTVGSYLSQIPGVITSVKFTLDNNTPWEIAMSSPDGGGGATTDDDVQELPMLLKCSVSFKPIHDFAPQTGLHHYFTAPQKNLTSNAKEFFTDGDRI